MSTEQPETALEMFARFNIEGARTTKPNEYRSAQREFLTMRARRSIKQTDEFARDLEIELAEFVRELQEQWVPPTVLG